MTALGRIDARVLGAALAGPRAVEPEAIEQAAEQVYERARLAHTLEGELPSPVDLLTRAGVVVVEDHLPDAVPVIALGARVVVRVGLDRTEAGLAVALAGAGAELARIGAPHTQGDAVALALALLLPRSTLATARDEGELSPEDLGAYQPRAPVWALQLRAEGRETLPQVGREGRERRPHHRPR